MGLVYASLIDVCVENSLHTHIEKFYIYTYLCIKNALHIALILTKTLITTIGTW